MKTVTLCGSLRFADAMKSIALELELHHDMNVLQCVYPSENIPITEAGREVLGRSHLQKIDLSDAIYVLDLGGYIGEAVQQEIAYARSKGREVLFHTHYHTERIRRLEALFDEVSHTFRTAPEALVPAKVQILTAYMDSGLWLLDYERDERGEFPKDLKRGILSQDALYDLICAIEAFQRQ